ncbi:diadenosine tetraphosphate (Ap4A) HIT family hydrolase [Nocardiopsis mwathae]|uniref:Diadenosine tetraphosphate (Ap4A) HIT family hydrolase n=1 Tax=Nocardiopsis mwathae TaxID=1472723 RepID=A0A7X0D6A7_9ACTN|nr:HIT family hydrolase [Nocardiopsis mwathae]MBB6173118.1 diadenosine tetraphosphate (Ap4A) HIT family hydrolase [Nocardiopsis mwathae]
MTGSPDGDGWTHDRVGAARRGENPMVLLRMRTGWAVIGDTQHLPGYCVLLFDGEADHLTDLTRARRAEFLFDLALLGEAVENACRARDPEFSRINYEVLGNHWPHLHGHVHARYRWEPDRFRGGPVWRYGVERYAEQHRTGPEHSDLRARLATAITTITAGAY